MGAPKPFGPHQCFDKSWAHGKHPRARNNQGLLGLCLKKPKNGLPNSSNVVGHFWAFASTAHAQQPPAVAGPWVFAGTHDLLECWWVPKGLGAFGQGAQPPQKKNPNFLKLGRFTVGLNLRGLHCPIGPSAPVCPRLAPYYKAGKAPLAIQL